MCAILSWVQDPLVEKQGVNNALVRDLFYAAAHWGPHSVGLTTLLAGEQTTFKKAISPDVFLRNSNHRIERAACAEKAIGHTRYRTHGPVIDRNAHPFEYYPFVHGSPDPTGRVITYAHNGVIGNYQEVARRFELGRLHVDSECLGALIDAKELFRAQGSVGLAWLDRGQLYCYRSGQDLHAYTVRKDDKVFTLVMSREAMLDYCYGRSLKGAAINETPLQPGTVYKVNIDGLAPVYQEQGYHHGATRRRPVVYAGG